MHRLRFLLAALLGVLAPALASRAGAAPEYAVVFESNVQMKARDGTVLTADIYRPKADGKFPVLLERTPYDKYTNLDSGLKGAARAPPAPVAPGHGAGGPVHRRH